MKKTLFIILIAIIGQSSKAQNVGIGTTTPNASAQLDVVSTSKGLLIPRMSAAQRIAIASPANGLMVYETTTSSMWVFNGSVWVQQASGGASPWATSGTDIYNTNSGDVGIGTTAPNSSAVLDVTSTTKGLLIPRMTGAQRNAIASPVAGLMVYQTNTVLTLPTSFPGFYVHSGTEWKLMARAENDSWTTSGNDQYSNVSGYVGIGENNPLAKLHVNGAIRAEGNVLLYDGLLLINNSTDNQNWLMSYYSSGSHLSFVDQGVPRLSLKNGGNIGINNMAPLTKLHIEGGQDAGLTSTTNGYIMLGTNTSSSNLLIDNNEIIVRTGFSTAGTLSLQNNGGEVSIGARTTINKDGEALKLDGNNPTMRFYQNGAYRSTIGVSSASDLSLTTTGGAIFLSPATASVVLNPSGGGNVLISPTGGGDVYINPNSGGKIQLNPTGGGNVSIGNISAAASGYKLAVTGKIICEEVRVKLSANWPDYVFNTDYKLPALGDVENFILQNKHLPNIPSASEVEKNGIEVGDIQKRMMEKIEELTLYIIEQSKRIIALENSLPATTSKK